VLATTDVLMERFQAYLLSERGLKAKVATLYVASVRSVRVHGMGRRCRTYRRER
jgi:hypothetical protein